MLFICIIIITITLLLLFNYNDEGFLGDSGETIFVSVPSYRDTDCKNTLRSIYKMARYPHLVYVGVFEQNDGTCPDEGCRIRSPYSVNIRYKHIPYTEAKGPFYARAVINNNLYKGEKYYLMIDAHSLFLKDWDINMKKQLNFLKKHGVTKPIISSYPHHQDFNESREILNKKKNVTTLICDVINGKEYPTEAVAIEKQSGKFYKSMLLGAGFLFTYGEFFREIRMDESLHHIFSGEEILLAIFAWTHGWDIYSPSYMNLFHYYNHKKPSWYKDVIKKDENSRNSEIKAYQKLSNIIETASVNDGMGKVRSIESFWKKLGFFREGATIKEKYPKSSKLNNCDNSPTINYPFREDFIGTF